MRGEKIPFALENDISTTAASGKIPQANGSGVIAAPWVTITVPSLARGLVYGFVGSPLPDPSTVPAGMKAYDVDADSVFQCEGSRWRLIA